MDLRLTFNEVPEDYDNLRPRYVDGLFTDVIQYSALDRTNRVLEIGIGTGQASLPFLETGCELTAVEIGDKLAQYARGKFSEFANLNVINQDFESIPLKEDSYDLIYSASAFHWIPLDTGMPKVFQLLKPGGVFAWFSAQPAPTQRNVYDEIQKVYDEYNQYFSGEKPKFNRQQEARRKQLDRKRAFKHYGFEEVEDSLHYGGRTLNARDYATLCSTYSDHRAIPGKERIQFLQKIEEAINRTGGVFTFEDTFLLCMGRKPH